MLKVNGSSIAVPARPPMPGTIPSTSPMMQPAPRYIRRIGSIRMTKALPADVAMKAISPADRIPCLTHPQVRSNDAPHPRTRTVRASRVRLAWQASCRQVDRLRRLRTSQRGPRTAVHCSEFRASRTQRARQAQVGSTGRSRQSMVANPSFPVCKQKIASWESRLIRKPGVPDDARREPVAVECHGLRDDRLHAKTGGIAGPGSMQSWNAC